MTIAGLRGINDRVSSAMNDVCVCVRVCARLGTLSYRGVSRLGAVITRVIGATQEIPRASASNYGFDGIVELSAAPICTVMRQLPPVYAILSLHAQRAQSSSSVNDTADFDTRLYRVRFDSARTSLSRSPISAIVRLNASIYRRFSAPTAALIVVAIHITASQLLSLFLSLSLSAFTLRID